MRLFWSWQLATTIGIDSSVSTETGFAQAWLVPWLVPKQAVRSELVRIEVLTEVRTKTTSFPLGGEAHRHDYTPTGVVLTRYPLSGIHPGSHGKQ